MVESILLMHLSDIHFRKPLSQSLYDLDIDLRNELERDAQRMRERLGDVYAILITGDIAFAGDPDEYKIAKEWLEKLCSMVGCETQNIFTTPGNHDVDRDAIRRSHIIQRIHQDFRTCAINEIDRLIQQYCLEDSTARKLLYQPLENYNNEFALLFGCVVNSGKPYWEQDLPLNDGSTLRMRGLNSIMVSNELDDDAGNKLILGSFQSTPIRQDGVEYLILCHHPPQWLRDQDRVEEILNNRARIQLFGHKHRQKIQKIEETHHESIRITAGATHPDRREPHWQPRYNYLTFSVIGEGETRNLNIMIYPRVWSDGKFIGDFNEAGEDSRIFSLALSSWSPSTKYQTKLTETAIPKELASEPPVQQRSDIMNPARRLTYRFLSLPYHIRIGIAYTLELLKDEDKGVSEAELFKRFFHRAKEKKILRRLWDEVERLHGNGRAYENPFSGD
jgi:predicted MPP superfamily phosphohydrolase